MWSILYVPTDGCSIGLYQIGPFHSKKDALTAARRCNGTGEDSKFDINATHVYLIGPKHELIELAESDLP